MRISDWSSDVCYSDLGPHGELNHLRRHLQKYRIEMAKQRHGPFCKACVLGHHALVFPENQAGSGRCLFGFVFNELLPLILIHYHMAEAQLFDIVARIADRDLAGMMEPVTIRDRKSTRLNSSH